MWAVWKDPFEMNPIRNEFIKMKCSGVHPFRNESFQIWIPSNMRNLSWYADHFEGIYTKVLNQMGIILAAKKCLGTKNPNTLTFSKSKMDK